MHTGGIRTRNLRGLTIVLKLGHDAAVAGSTGKKLEVCFFMTEAGGEPVREWLKSLTRDAKVEIGADIQRVQWRWPVSKPLVGALSGGLYEVRSTVANVEYRVLFVVKGNQMILLHGFVKKTQRAQGEIAEGRRRQKLVERE